MGGLLTVAQAWFVSQVIARVFLAGATLANVAPDLAVLLVVIVARGLTVFGSDVAAGHVAIQVKTTLRALLFEHLLALGPRYVQGQRTGELTTTVVEGVEALDPYFSQYLPQLALAALVPLTVLAAVFPRDPLSAVVLLVTAPLIPLFMILIGKATDALAKRQYDLLSHLSAHFLDVLQGLTTLKQLGQAKRQARVIERTSERYREATLAVLRVAFLSALALELLSTLSTAIVAVEIGLRLLYGRLDFQAALFILILAPEFYLPLRMLGVRFHAAT
ncbi:MAG: thiol reductant ABC exporter subunit CydD, partial [Anaerolineae bacterium]|nr:thiol reductant ABC exporter subunit CydD [Anaerolineae bacterium]